MQSGELEAGRLGEAARHVHRLNAIACGPLHQVVDGAERDDALAAWISGEPDIREVRSGQEPRLRVAEDAGALLHDPDERLVGVRLAVRAPAGLVVDAALHRHVRGGQYPANELDRGDGQLNADAELLLDLRGVPVADRLERADDTGALRMV